jgi:hypothetical protein
MMHNIQHKKAGFFGIANYSFLFDTSFWFGLLAFCLFQSLYGGKVVRKGTYLIYTI